MNIFITVGNTHYNALFKAVNEHLLPEQYNIVNQIADGDYIPDKHKYFRFTTQFDDEVNAADLIITHAGAGSVFQLLELGKPMVVVPNFERVDAHQKDLADYVKQHNFACVCDELANLELCIIAATEQTYAKYQRVPFTGYSLINQLLIN